MKPKKKEKIIAKTLLSLIIFFFRMGCFSRLVELNKKDKIRFWEQFINFVDFFSYFFIIHKIDKRLDGKIKLKTWTSKFSKKTHLLFLSYSATASQQDYSPLLTHSPLPPTASHWVPSCSQWVSTLRGVCSVSRRGALLCRWSTNQSTLRASNSPRKEITSNFSLIFSVTVKKPMYE